MTASSARTAVSAEVIVVENNDKPINVTGMIIDYEQGELSREDDVVLFAELIRSGLAWRLQGHYGRMAENLISHGIIDSRGEIDWNAFDDCDY